MVSVKEIFKFEIFPFLLTSPNKTRLLCHKSCKTLSYKCIFNFFNLQKSSFSFSNIEFLNYFEFFEFFDFFKFFLILWKFSLKTQECWNFLKSFQYYQKITPISKMDVCMVWKLKKVNVLRKGTKRRSKTEENFLAFPRKAKTLIG